MCVVVSCLLLICISVITNDVEIPSYANLSSVYPFVKCMAQSTFRLSGKLNGGTEISHVAPAPTPA